MSQRSDSREASVLVENIGGIDRCELSIERGVTVLSGHNATNRTSLLRAIGGAIGGSVATLKSDSDEGRIQLELNGESYTRHYRRGQDGTVTTEGTPFTTESERVDLFACLLKDNAARQAVERGDDLRDVLMRPVDTASIQAQIRELERERNEIADRLDQIKRERGRLPDLETRRADLKSELESIIEDIESLRDQVAEADVDEDETGEAQELLRELDSQRQSLAQTREEMETERVSLEALREERQTVLDELDDIDAPDLDQGAIEEEFAELQDRASELRDSINDLSAIVDFNENLLDSPDTISDPGQDESDVTDELDPMSATVACWTCGSRVERGDIDDQLAELRRVIEEKRGERQAIQAQIEGRREKLEQIRSVETHRRDLENRLDEIDDQIARRERRLETLEEQKDELETSVRDLEEEVKATEELRESGLVERYERLSELEFERGRLEQELNDVEVDIRELESLTDEREQLEAQNAELEEELESLRTRIEDLEREAVEAFNDHMAEVIDLLEYENIERVWIERKTQDRGPEGVFELHVVRATDEGAVYEDTVDNLSESEREVIGLVVALAGFLVHEVYETVPVMLLDSLEAIDATRIGRLIEYLAEFASYLIVALLEEDAQGLDESYTRLSADALGS